MGSVILLVAIETKNAEITRRTGVGRKEEIVDLIAAFDRVVHGDHLNPERIGCPGRPALTRLASEPRSAESPTILDHIRECEFCVDELRDIRRSRKGSKL